MSFGKLSLKQILQSPSALIAFYISSFEEYEKLRECVLKYEDTLHIVQSWNSYIYSSECRLPCVLKINGSCITKLEAVQSSYYLVSIDDIELDLPEDIITFSMKKLQSLTDKNKQRILDLIVQLEKEEQEEKNIHKYWWIDSDGFIHEANREDNATAAHDRTLMGNYFLTREEAEYEYRRRMAVAKWKKIHKQIEGNQDSAVYSKRCYFPVYKIASNNVIIACSFGSAPFATVFSSEEKCRRAIQLLGEMKVRDYILEVKD